jgi:alpha-L-rhamnosidase
MQQSNVKSYGVEQLQNNKRIWHPKITGFENIYVAFQAEIQIEEAGNPYAMSIFGSNAYRAYVDGEEMIQGPARFDRGHPENDEVSFSLKQGIHVLTVIVHYFGVSTRFIASDIPAFLQCELRSKREIIPLQWLCKELTAYTHTGRRLNGQLGWMEQCDVRLLSSFNLLHQGPDWIVPIEISLELGEYLPKQISDCHNLPKEGILLSQGNYADRFGYRDDDPPVRFMLRDLYTALPADGVWLRYDFGLIGLYYPEITLDVPEGTLVEAGYSETLTDGKVAPFITLSASASCSMDRWTTKEWYQELKTFSPRGFRFLELHIAAPADHIKHIGVVVKQKTYFASLNGAFQCSDSRLNEI